MKIAYFLLTCTGDAPKCVRSCMLFIVWNRRNPLYCIVPLFSVCVWSKENTSIKNKRMLHNKELIAANDCKLCSTLIICLKKSRAVSFIMRIFRCTLFQCTHEIIVRISVIGGFGEKFLPCSRRARLSNELGPCLTLRGKYANSRTKSRILD